MKVFLTIMALGCLPLSLQATGPDYNSSKKWIKANSTNAIDPHNNLLVVYVGSIGKKQEAFVLPLDPTLTIRSIIDRTIYHGRDALVVILRASHPVDPVAALSVKANEMPTFKFDYEDVIWIVDPHAPQS